MKAILVTAFVSYEPRLRLVKNALESLGVTCQVLTTDFDHRAKAHRTTIPLGFTALPTRPYASNISLARILSHRDFAKRAFAAIEKEKPDLLYVLVPPNSLADKAAHYKTRHSDVKLIIDVCDLWPEALPRPLLKKALFPAMALWRLMRDASIPKADLILTECDLFRQKASLKNAEIVYWCASDVGTVPAPHIRIDAVELAYLGSINNILDIERTERFVRDVAKEIPVRLHIIGVGERKEEFLAALNRAGAQVIDYGPIYEEAKKAEIFSRCRYGINIMRHGVLVGLSMKSIDYLKFGLPLINSLAGDTECIVREEGVGVNLTESTAHRVATESQSDLYEARARARALFESTFSLAAVRERMTLILNEFLAGGGELTLLTVGRAVKKVLFRLFKFEFRNFKQVRSYRKLQPDFQVG